MGLLLSGQRVRTDAQEDNRQRQRHEADVLGHPMWLAMPPGVAHMLPYHLAVPVVDLDR